MSSEEHIHDPEFGDDDFGPIDAAEREALTQDLVDVKTLKAVLSGRGVRGVVVFCPDCDEDHYLGWDLLAGNLEQILNNGTTPVHEPAWDPDPDEYVTWDYARGFLDGYESYAEDRSLDQTCPWCATLLPEASFDWAYCPYCGKDFATVNLVAALRRKGWSSDRIEELFRECGLSLPSVDSDGTRPVLPFDPQPRSE
ncbi:MAG: DUF5319 domain-containing protein [Actinomycetota bacterium]|nr:DUF5319 domain-containing protein [Actinomycetota bacterium]